MDKITIRIEGSLGPIELVFKKESNKYIIKDSLNDFDDAYANIFSDIVNGKHEYKIIKKEFVDFMKQNQVLEVPSEWIHEKKYTGLPVKDALLFYIALFGFSGDKYSLNGEDIKLTETLEELEERFKSFES